jgi:hypothetical protein
LFDGKKNRASSKLFVFGILNDEAALKDPLQFRDGTSSMSLLCVELNAYKNRKGELRRGGFDDYVSKCIANYNTGTDGNIIAQYIDN